MHHGLCDTRGIFHVVIKQPVLGRCRSASCFVFFLRCFLGAIGIVPLVVLKTPDSTRKARTSVHAASLCPAAYGTNSWALGFSLDSFLCTLVILSGSRGRNGEKQRDTDR